MGTSNLPKIVGGRKKWAASNCSGAKIASSRTAAGVTPRGTETNKGNSQIKKTCFGFSGKKKIWGKRGVCNSSRKGDQVKDD